MGDPIGVHGRTGPGFGPPSTGPLDSTSSKAVSAFDGKAGFLSLGNDLYDHISNVPESDMTAERKDYDEFLSRFPLRHDIWIKYANQELCTCQEKAKSVYDRAVDSVPHSPHIWCSFCEFLISCDESPDVIRGYFEKGLAQVGTNYDSNILWDKWIKFEEDHKEWNNLAKIYVRILAHPIQNLEFYHDCFNGFVGAHSSEIKIDLNLSDVTAKFEKAKELDKKIKCFELYVQTRCFTSSALNNSEIKNWHCYLDFMEKHCKADKVCKLYERCLIACASYPEFWIRYVLYLSHQGLMGLANEALLRAITICVKEEETLHIFSAFIQEFYGDVSKARSELERLCSRPTVVLDVTIKLANLERRLQGKEHACKVYERIIGKEKLKEQSHILASLQLAYGRFLLSVCRDISKTRVLLDEVLLRGHLTKEHIEDIIDLEKQIPGKKHVDSVAAAVEKFLKEDFTQDVSEINAKENISLSFITFLERFGDAHRIKKARHQHVRLFSGKEVRHIGLQKRKFMEDVGGGCSKRVKKEAQQLAPKDCQSRAAKDDQCESSKVEMTVAARVAKESLGLLSLNTYGSDSD